MANPENTSRGFDLDLTLRGLSLRWLDRFRTLWRSPLDADRRYAGGLLVWSVVVIVVAVPELIAATSGGNPLVWHTISNTIGHLQAYHGWVSLIVVGVIAAVALHVLVNPLQAPQSEPRMPRTHRRLGKTPGGRFTLRPGSKKVEGAPRTRVDGDAPWRWTIGYLAVSLVVVVVVAVIVHGTLPGFGFELVLYLGIALLFIVVPNVLAIERWRETPFASFFATARRLQASHPVVGIVLAAGLAVLAFHLAMYPWPTRCYVDDVQHWSACFRP
jgi:hypothetical protein